MLSSDFLNCLKSRGRAQRMRAAARANLTSLFYHKRHDIKRRKCMRFICAVSHKKYKKNAALTIAKTAPLVDDEGLEPTTPRM